MDISGLRPSEIAQYFREHPETARALMSESCNKHFTPSTFLGERPAGFMVGWCDREARYVCVQQFSNLPDAATDYLLFSLGKGRWHPEGDAEETFAADEG
jgi:hypothetical protein